MENVFKVLLLFLSLIALVRCEETKCQACKQLVEGILKGLDKTKNKNFEGGDVHWEEKKLGKYKDSETRLIEVLEHGCSKGSFKCNSLKEEYEEFIEEWFKNPSRREKESLHDILCVKESKSCCPDGHFGKECEKCPQNDAGKVCSGRGSCKGDGDTEGTGECECDEAFSGETCNECSDNHYETSRNDTHLVCDSCHSSCRTCRNNETTGCMTCMDGYREKENIDNEEEKECVDIDECTEKDNLCEIGKYCSNTNGSYECKVWKCHPFCTKCYGPLHTNCLSCTVGFIMRRPFVCTDIDECASGAICLGMYEVCVNTFGHYRCECARNFRRDPQTGQCQPDPGVYPGMFNKVAAEEAARQKIKEKMEEADEEETKEAAEDAKEEL